MDLSDELNTAMSDYGETIKKMERSQEVLRAAIGDLTKAADILDEYIDILRNPIGMVLSSNTEKEMNNKINLSQVYFGLAANKMQAYQIMTSNIEGEEGE